MLCRLPPPRVITGTRLSNVRFIPNRRLGEQIVSRRSAQEEDFPIAGAGGPCHMPESLQFHNPEQGDRLEGSVQVQFLARSQSVDRLQDPAKRFETVTNVLSNIESYGVIFHGFACGLA